LTRSPLWRRSRSPSRRRSRSPPRHRSRSAASQRRPRSPGHSLPNLSPWTYIDIPLTSLATLCLSHDCHRAPCTLYSDIPPSERTKTEQACYNMTFPDKEERGSGIWAAQWRLVMHGLGKMSLMQNSNVSGPPSRSQAAARAGGRSGRFGGTLPVPPQLHRSWATRRWSTAPDASGFLRWTFPLVLSTPWTAHS
jgi:hypothetical protein